MKILYDFVHISQVVGWWTYEVKAMTVNKHSNHSMHLGTTLI